MIAVIPIILCELPLKFVNTLKRKAITVNGVESELPLKFVNTLKLLDIDTALYGGELPLKFVNTLKHCHPVRNLNGG